MSPSQNSIDFVSIDRSALPDEEHEAARSIELNLIMLASLTDEFRCHVDLYRDTFQRKQGVGWENHDERMKLVTWMRGASRLGALDAYSFSIIMEAINATKAPTIWSRADMRARREASKLFASEFPLIAAIRPSAAHFGELSKSPAEQNRHRLKEAVYGDGMFLQSDSGLFMQSSVHAEPDRAIYGSTYKGKMATYELSDAKADILATVAHLYRETLYPLESPTDAEHRVQGREIDLLRAKGELSIRGSALPKRILYVEPLPPFPRKRERSETKKRLGARLRGGED